MAVMVSRRALNCRKNAVPGLKPKILRAMVAAAEGLRHPKAPGTGVLGTLDMGHHANARRMIEEHQPILSICVYHKQDDLWRIPLLIHSLAEDYRFYLRAHDV